MRLGETRQDQAVFSVGNPSEKVYHPSENLPVE